MLLNFLLLVPDLASGPFPVFPSRYLLADVLLSWLCFLLLFLLLLSVYFSCVVCRGLPYVSLSFPASFLLSGVLLVFCSVLFTAFCHFTRCCSCCFSLRRFVFCLVLSYRPVLPLSLRLSFVRYCLLDYVLFPSIGYLQCLPLSFAFFFVFFSSWELANASVEAGGL